MEEKKFQSKKLSLSNTKQEMLEAYQTVLKQLEAQKEAELKPSSLAIWIWTSERRYRFRTSIHI
jgi:hypothetical protein